MAEWLNRGVPLSRDLLAFCSIEDGGSPDEHALEVMASKGDWNNRFGQVRLTASRAVLSCIRDALDMPDAAAVALIASAVHADGLKPSDLAPGRGGWGDNKQTLEGWSNARMTEAALVRLWIDGRLPPSADARMRAMLDRSAAVAFTLGVFARDERIGLLRARGAMRRCEEMLRSCRNRLAHPKGASAGTYQLVGAILVAAEAWAAGIAVTLGPQITFPDEWLRWTAWDGARIAGCLHDVNASKRWMKRDIVSALASLKRPQDLGLVIAAFQSAGGGFAELSRTSVDTLLQDCFAATAPGW
jgi:hypothetical protein